MLDVCEKMVWRDGARYLISHLLPVHTFALPQSSSVRIIITHRIVGGAKVQRRCVARINRKNDHVSVKPSRHVLHSYIKKLSYLSLVKLEIFCQKINHLSRNATVLPEQSKFSKDSISPVFWKHAAIVATVRIST